MSLSFEEAKEFFKNHFGSDQSDEQLKATFDKIDKNGNGSIEKYELIEFLKKANSQNWAIFYSQNFFTSWSN